MSDAQEERLVGSPTAAAAAAHSAANSLSSSRLPSISSTLLPTGTDDAGPTTESSSATAWPSLAHFRPGNFGQAPANAATLGAEWLAVPSGGREPIPEGDMESVVNVTREYPFEYALVMFGYVMPFVVVLTIITNSLIVIVLLKPHMRTPTNIVLVSMALVDVGTLISPWPWYLYIYTLGNHDKLLYPPLSCYAHHIMTDVVPVFFHTSSIWLALLLASQRYIYVCHPTLARTWCTVPRVKRAIFLILLVALTHQATRFVDNEFSAVVVTYNQGRHLACKNEIAPWVQRVDIALYYTTYYTFRIFFVFIIPCAALITLNYLLFRALKRAENKRTELLRTKFKLVGVGVRGAGHARPARAGQANKCQNFSVIDGEAARELSSCLVGAEGAAGATICALEQMASAVPMAQLAGSEADEADELEAIAKLQPSRGDDDQEAEEVRSDGQDDDYDELDDEPVSECPECAECAAYERELAAHANSCRRCSALLDGFGHHGSARASRPHSCQMSGATVRAPARHETQARQQATVDSQCSSVVAGLTTNTITNNNHTNTSTKPNTNDEHEDLASSSCPASATHNVSSGQQSVALAGDETLEANSMHHDHRHAHEPCASTPEGAPVEEQPTLAGSEEQSRASQADDARKATTLTGSGRRLVESGSVDSRLVCGCFATSRARTLSKLRLLPAGRHKSALPARSGQPTPIGGEQADVAVVSGRHEPEVESSTSMGTAAGRRVVSPAPLARCATSELPLRKRSAELPGERRRSGLRAALTRPLRQQSPASSALSMRLLQVAPTINQDHAFASPPSRAAEPGGRAKSASFASSLGRGSRATLVGLPGTSTAPLAISSANHHHAHGHALARNYPHQYRQLGAGAGGGAGGGHQSVRTMDSNRTTLMLVVVVSVFLVVEVPVAIVTILHVVENLFDLFKSDEFSATLDYIKLFTNFFIMISYSVNFTIYCSMSKKFRETFRDLFLCGAHKQRKHARRILYQTQQQPSQYLVTAVNNNNNLNHNHNNNNNHVNQPPQQPQPQASHVQPEPELPARRPTSLRAAPARGAVGVSSKQSACRAAHNSLLDSSTRSGRGDCGATTGAQEQSKQPDRKWSQLVDRLAKRQLTCSASSSGSSVSSSTSGSASVSGSSASSSSTGSRVSSPSGSAPPPPHPQPPIKSTQATDYKGPAEGNSHLEATRILPNGNGTAPLMRGGCQL